MVQSRDSIKLDTKNKKFNFLNKLKKNKAKEVKVEITDDIIPLKEFVEKTEKGNEKNVKTPKNKKTNLKNTDDNRDLIETLDEKASEPLHVNNLFHFDFSANPLIEEEKYENNRA